MLEGLFAAASGMAAQQQQIDAVANDLANENTPGYQAVRVGFRDLLYSSGGEPNNMITPTGAGAAASVEGRSQTQGAIQRTSRPLDVALQGPGYIAVQQPGGGVALTRNGALELDAQGQITTADGQLLAPPITVPPGTQPSAVEIDAGGAVRVGNRTLGQIRILDVPAPDGLQALGDSLYRPTAASGQPRAAGGTTLQQGALEAANVDISSEMAQMIDAQQSYAMASKAVDFQNQMLQIANQVKR